MPLVIYTLVFATAVLLGLAAVPLALERGNQYVQQRVEESRIRMADIFLDLSHQNLWLLYVGSPLGLGLAAWLLSGVWVLGLAGVAAGLVLPKFVLKQIRARRQSRFHAQLVDCLLLLGSCLRAGLSMTQAFGVVAEEMPKPAGEEFGLVLKETRMGLTLDQAMAHLKERMPLDDVGLFNAAVLVSRQTGGDVTAVFGRLVETLRERKKIRERIKTLTFMAKMQGVVMAMLPVMFSIAVYSMDRAHFNFFLQDPTGKLLLLGVIAMQVFGAFLFIRFSRSPI